MSRPLVSIAMATYNGARYLRAQLDTLYAQTWPNLEVVATDDASTDGTVAILAEFAERRGLRYAVNGERQGLVRNFERAISLCQGDLIALSDQDDLWRPHKIETLLAHLGEFTLIYCNTQDVLTPEGRPDVDTSTAQVVDFARAFGTGKPTRQLLAENWVVSHTLMFRRQLVAHALPIPPRQTFHDAWLALVASKLDGIKYLDERLQTYRQHPDSLTYLPADWSPPTGGLGALLGGRFRARWRQRCASETARLTDALDLQLLDHQDRAFLGDLLTYYGSGIHRGLRWRALRCGWRIAPFVATAYGTGTRWKFGLRGLLGGI